MSIPIIKACSKQIHYTLPRNYTRITTHGTTSVSTYYSNKKINILPCFIFNTDNFIINNVNNVDETYQLKKPINNIPHGDIIVLKNNIPSAELSYSYLQHIGKNKFILLYKHNTDDPDNNEVIKNDNFAHNQLIISPWLLTLKDLEQAPRARLNL